MTIARCCKVGSIALGCHGDGVWVEGQEKYLKKSKTGDKFLWNVETQL